MQPAALADSITEASFQQAVCDLAQLNGWIYYHTFDSRRSPAGFLDLVLCHAGPHGALTGGQLLFAELKTAKGKVTIGQQIWLRTLTAAGAEVHLWRPDDWPEIVDRLKRKTVAA
jgi:hypothetical protein